MLSSLDRHHICEIMSCYPFLVKQYTCQLFHALFFPHYLLHLSLIQCLYIQLCFLLISHLGGRWKKSGVKTRPSQQTVLAVEADLLLGPDSSSEMDSETDDQSYSPTEVYALTWHGYTAHIMHTVSCIA